MALGGILGKGGSKKTKVDSGLKKPSNRTKCKRATGAKKTQTGPNAREPPALKKHSVSRRDMAGMPLILQGLLQSPDNTDYAIHMIRFEELTRREQQKALSINEQILQNVQVGKSLADDIVAMKTDMYSTIPSRLLRVRYVKPMQPECFNVESEIAVRQKLMRKHASRTMALEAELCALYEKVDMDLLKRMGHLCYDTAEMYVRFEDMRKNVPTGVELSGRLSAEYLKHTTWDGYLRQDLQDATMRGAREGDEKI